MKRFLGLALIVLVVGCVEPPPRKPEKFRAGEKVKIVVNEKPAIVLSTSGEPGYTSHYYNIRYSNDLGELQFDSVKEWELQKWEE